MMSMILPPAPGLEKLCNAMVEQTQSGPRKLVAVAAPPAAGKSTFAAALVQQINAQAGKALAVAVPMDGFHLDNAILSERGLLARKGAPETFDAEGFIALITRLRREDDVVVPLFDRARDLSVAGAAVVSAGHRVVVVEGNYLLLDRAPWDALAPLWDVTVWLEVPLEELERRLIQRWLDNDHTPDAARARALGNDIPNARLVTEASRKADLTIKQ